MSMKFFTKIAMIGLVILIGAPIKAHYYEIAIIKHSIRVSMQITNKSGKNLNIFQKGIRSNEAWRVGSVRKNDTTLISDIQFEKGYGYKPNIIIAKLEAMDAQENKQDHLITIELQKSSTSEHRRILASISSAHIFGVDLKPWEADNLSGFVDVDPLQGAVTALIDIIIGDGTQQNATKIDITAMQGSQLD